MPTLQQRSFRFVLFLAAAAVVLSGCVSRWPADPMRASGFAEMGAASGSLTKGDGASFEVEWPERRMDWTGQALIREGTERRLWFTGLAIRKTGLQTRMQPINVRVLRTAPRGQGVIAQVEPVEESVSREGWLPSARYLFYSAVGTGVPVELLAEPGHLRRRGGAGRSRPATPVVFRLLEARSPDGSSQAAAPARGLVIAFSSFGDPRYEAKVIDALRDRGWAVLVTSFPIGTLFTTGPREHQRSSPERFAAWAAARVDDRLGEWAFACEAVLEELAEMRPDIPQRPLVLVGSSAGAIGLPAAALRLSGKVDAAVLTGGGANIIRIVHGSKLFSMVDELRWGTREGEEVDTKTMERLSRAYLEASRLDPYHASAALRGVPVLMLHASWDTIVPAECGDVLYQQLGRPERWNFSLGHELLFWRLPAYAGQIARWVDGAVERR